MKSEQAGGIALRALAAFALVGGADAQTAAAGGAAPAGGFDVVSVKAVDRGQRLPTRLEWSPGRFSSVAPLRLIVGFAYSLADPDILGGQSWHEAGDRVYAIDAVADRPFDLAGCRLMVRSLLQERFRLAVHGESRERSVYALAIARGGHKLQEVAGTSAGGGIATTINGVPVHSGRDKSASEGMSMAALVGALQASILRSSHLPGAAPYLPIVDQTGLTGIYRIRLNFAIRPDDDSKPDLFTALQEQLGLKLEAAKESRGILVVDAVGEPDPN
jgi:uncharacterized protein (TIGR03435 family)